MEHMLFTARSRSRHRRRTVETRCLVAFAYVCSLLVEIVGTEFQEIRARKRSSRTFAISAVQCSFPSWRLGKQTRGACFSSPFAMHFALRLLVVAAPLVSAFAPHVQQSCSAVTPDKCGTDWNDSCLKCGTSGDYDCEKCCSGCKSVTKGTYKYCECSGPKPGPSPIPARRR